MTKETQQTSDHEIDYPTIYVDLDWRDLKVRCRYFRILRGRSSNSCYISSDEPFYKKIDCLVRWLPSLVRPKTEEGLGELVRGWLDSGLENSAQWREADMKRSQLSLFD